MRIKITESQLSNLLLIKENDDNCHETNDFLVGCYDIITKGDFSFKYIESNKGNNGCYIEFNKVINDYKMTLWLYEDKFMELHIKTPKNKIYIYTAEHVNLIGGEIKISNFYDMTDSKKNIKTEIYTWDDLITSLRRLIDSKKEKTTISESELLEDIKKLEDLLSYNVDDDDFKKITTIVRKYMKNKEDFCKLRSKYFTKTRDYIYEEIVSVGISTQSLVTEFHKELDKMPSCEKL